MIARILREYAVMHEVEEAVSGLWYNRSSFPNMGLQLAKKRCAWVYYTYKVDDYCTAELDAMKNEIGLEKRIL